MNKEEIEDIMKDMDDKTVEKISADYKVGDDSAKERIYKEIVRRMNSENDAENTAVGDEVSGVETYRRRNITRIISAAAAFIIVAGAVGGGAYLLKGHKSKSPVQTSDEIVEATTSPATAAVTERTTEPTTTVKTVEVTTSVAVTETAVTTTEPAAVTTEPVTSSEEQNNGAISKQEIYDKCISNSMNSVAYTAEIEEIVSERNVAKYWYNNHPDSTETKIKMYSYDASNNITYIEKYEHYLFSDNTYVSIYDPRETLDVGASNVESTISVGVSEPMDGGGSFNILDAFRGSSIITPYNSKYLLSDFSKWDIKGIETYLSRECAVIEGSEIYIAHTDEAITINYTIYVDIETGAWMRISYNDINNEENTIEVKRLSIGDEADKPLSKSELKAKINKLIDEEGFELYSANDYSVSGRKNVDLSILDE